MARNTKKTVYKFRNMFLNALYPFGLVFAALTGVVLAWYTLYYSPEACESIFCLGWIYSSVWAILMWVPGISLVPEVLQVAYASLLAGFVFAILLATLQRYLLRGLLTYKGWMWADRKAKNYHIKAWALLVKLLSGSSPMLYSFQGSLPRLPVPGLKATTERYLESVRPVLDDEEYARMSELAAGFVANEGPSLQRYLVLKSWYARNYVSDWWQRFVYLRGRSSICINSNYYTLDSQAELGTSNPVARAARMITLFLEFKRLKDHEEIEPIMAGGTPFCMDQYQQLFSTTRVPGREEDKLVTFEDSRHIVVTVRGNYYSLPVFSHSGRVLSVGEIEDQLTLIVADAEANPDESAAGKVPALTGTDRTKWAQARSDYFSSGRNKVSLNLIESAIFYLHFDTASPGSDWSSMAHELIHGSGANLWFDKSVQLVVFADAHIGLNVEHSFADALVIAHLWEHVLLSYESMASSGLELYGPDGLNIREAGDPGKSIKSISTKLQFDIPAGSQAESAILEAESTIIAASEDLDLHVHHFSSFGKEVCKRLGMSPDAFVQMGLQLAYYRDSGGKFVLTYEAASTRLYRNGRTETIRSCSNESVAFVKALESGAPAEEVAELLKVAVEKHGETTRNAMTGRGVDRHLFALYVVSLGTETESEFLQEAIKQPWVLSTSQQPIKQTNRWNPNKSPDKHRISHGGGFGPVADKGYGCSYLIAGDGGGFHFHVSSKVSAEETNSQRFIGHLDQALRDMAALFEQ